MRAYAAGRASAVATTLRGPQLEVGTNTDAFYVLEVGVFNTTTTAFAAGLQRFSASGTIGAGLTEQSEDTDYTPNVAASNTNTTDMTAAGGAYTQASIGAAIGAGVIWTFGGKGLRVPGTADSGMCIICPTGTGQIFDFYWVWEE